MTVRRETRTAQTCPEGHERGPYVKRCAECAKAYKRKYYQDNKEELKRKISAYDKTEAGKAARKKSTANRSEKLKRQNAAKLGQRRRRKVSVIAYVMKARAMARMFLECWTESTEGATLKREALPKLHDVRALATYVKYTSPYGINENTI